MERSLIKLLELHFLPSRYRKIGKEAFVRPENALKRMIAAKCWESKNPTEREKIWGNCWHTDEISIKV